MGSMLALFNGSYFISHQFVIFSTHVVFDKKIDMWHLYQYGYGYNSSFKVL